MRTLSILALGLCLSAGTARAESYFVCLEPFETGSAVSLGTVVSEGDGVIELYDFHAGEMGEMLAEVPVHAGANRVRAHSMQEINDDLFARLVVDGEVVATHIYRACDD
ncbi:hypothetical protein [Histidinibacterium aquaticum]|uniref:Elongation factor P n=1 Tax=Histidinibacterium aquaticum TaxID=2613962 RepID=A0A5J5GEW7_9RHOB|nr:hypothetical protein [Histidinibacterium aquaticum]KAA9006715.1 hypothetical protein F3S47_13100 [Histidinibacterium aquaticum]